jgi:hypothetical protein
METLLLDIILIFGIAIPLWIIALRRWYNGRME